MLLKRTPQVAVRSSSVHSIKPARLPVLARATAAVPVEVEAKKTKVETDSKPEEPELPDVEVSTKDVQAFLNNMVSNTNIAELHLQVGNLKLKVRRSTGAPVAYAPAAPAPAEAAYNGPQIVITKAAPVDTLKTMEETVDESLVPIYAPKVGIFRRGKYAGGKRVGKGNAVNTGDSVKKGRVLGYVEQLGTFVPVEAPQAGELVKVLVEDGASVEYKQEILELAPFFGGALV